ncbi:hypothetical protein [Acinetobacter sp. ANC 3813]|uniref:hypothetical protein n=1 Tax=Acinetobacter sp. ANC 3813 TaxID=1977873 RepID=UPI000A345FB5|nr:hypothetical protein [Acinetobacter sp. ANC 3813]OTG90069.1 hypothetical protein B9T34_09595 [Acinetobacter sp. ANC 3813]
MKINTIKAMILVIPILSIACATTSQNKLNQSLQHYIGQSADQVQQQLNLNQFGFKISAAPIQTQEKLSHTIIRHMPIPMGTPNLGTSIAMGTTNPMQSKGNLNIEMKCQINFMLRDNQVESIEYVGKAC